MNIKILLGINRMKKCTYNKIHSYSPNILTLFFFFNNKVIQKLTFGIFKYYIILLAQWREAQRWNYILHKIKEYNERQQKIIKINYL